MTDRSRPRRQALVLRSVLAVTVAALVAGGAPTRAVAGETPAPEDAYVVITPDTVQPGEKITVETSGWRAATQLQAVVCGANAIGGSVTCDLSGAVTALATPEGSATHVLTVATPPRPCPCVVRVSSFVAPVMALNVPFTLTGHRVADPPEPQPGASDLRVDQVELRGHGGLRSLLGLGGSSTMVITLTNHGDVEAPVPDLSYGFGRGDVEPDGVVEGGTTMGPGQARNVEVAVDVPMLAFGTHQGVARWADGTGGVASAGLTVYPFGALLLLLGSVAAAAVTALQRRRQRDRLEEVVTPGAHRFLDDDGTYPLPDVVYLEDIGGYLVKPGALKGSRVVRRISGRVSVDDLAALVEGGDQAVASYADGTPLPPTNR